MAVVYVENGYPIFTDLDGTPLHEGYIYIGVDGMNPLSNPQQAYWDEALGIPATNIRTVNGYASFKGSPGRLHTADAYSILVQNKQKQTVYYQPSAVYTASDVDQDLSSLANGWLPVGTVLPQNGVTFPGFLTPDTAGLSGTLYPELYALAGSLDFIEDTGNNTFNVLPLGHDTGWVFNSAWQGATFTIIHEIGKALSYLDVVFEISQIGTDATAIRVETLSYDAASASDAIQGVALHADTADQFLVKTGDNGVSYINTDGERVTLTTDSWYYRVQVKRKDTPYPAQIKAEVLENGDALTTLLAETGWTALSDWTNAQLAFNHGLDIENPFVVLWISTDGTYSNGFVVGLGTDGTNSKGMTLFVRDSNNILIQTGANGFWATEDGTTLSSSGAGDPVTVAAQNWYYNILVYKPQLITNTAETDTDTIIMSVDGSTYTLPTTADIGDHLSFIVKPFTVGATLIPPSNGVIVQGLSNRAEEVFYFRQGQELKLTKIGASKGYTGDFDALSDPAILPTDVGRGAAWSPDGRYLVIAHETTPYLTIYDWNSGSPVKISDPATLPTGDGQGAAWSPDGRYLAIAHDTSPYVTIYDWNSGSPVKISDPATLPTGAGNEATWSPDGRYLAIAHDTSPAVTIYDWNSGSPVKISNPATLPTTNGFGAAWSPDGRYLAIAHDTSPYVTIYDWKSGSPVKISNPATLPASISTGAAWPSDGRYLVVTHFTSPYVTIYDWNSGSPVKISNPATLPTGPGRDATWSPDGRYLVVSHDTSPYVTIYDWKSGSPVKISNPATLPTGDGWGTAWSPSGEHIAVATEVTPFVALYDTFETLTNAWAVSHISGLPIRNIDFESQETP